MNWSLTLRERREREELPDDASPPAFMYQKGTRFRAGNLAAATTALPRLSISTHHSWLRDLAVISPSSNRNRVMVCRSFAKQRVRHVMDRIKVSISQSEVGYPRGLKFPTSANPDLPPCIERFDFGPAGSRPRLNISQGGHTMPPLRRMQRHFSNQPVYPILE